MLASPPDHSERIQEALRQFWGFDTLRPLQGEVVEAALNNRDAVVVMPTGGGKSLCFQLPAVVTNSLTVVISPLIALMKDQVDALKVVGIPAAALNSTLTAEEENEVRRQVVQGELRLLYVSPERLLSPSTLSLLNQANVARFAIDEAHCISAWGHDFRPEFRQLGRIKEVFPDAPVMGFTATATPKVQRDIAIQLNLERPRKFVGVFDRPNLTYRIVAKDDPVRRTVEAVQRYPDEGVIVYCLSRKDTEAIANALVAQGIPAVAYHAGLPNETRKKVSEEFAQEKVNIVVATIAFGMGIDRANVRCVIHECLPKSMEGYQQETGRAGRDGLPSECVLLYNHGDVVRLKRLLSGGEPEVQAHQEKLLEEVRRFATSHHCRHKALTEYFGQEYESEPGGCGACDVCLGGTQPLANSNEVAHQILATTAELLQKGRGFGVAFLALVLTGSQNKTVIERGGDKLQGFAAFSSEAKERVSSWIYQLMDLGYLAVSEGQYPMVSLTEEGRDALMGESEITLIENVALLVKAGSSRRSKTSEISVEGVDQPLFEKMRAWRRQIASDQGVPAYVVFHDATLMRIAAIRPSTLDRLRGISGIGERRANEFGEQLLALVLEHAEATGATLDEQARSTPPKPTAPVTAKTSAYFAYFAEGLPIEEVAAKVGLKPTTLYDHLVRWVSLAKPPNIDPWVDPAIQERVKEALTAVDSLFLKPVFDYLNGEISYDQIRIVKAFVTLDSK